MDIQLFSTDANNIEIPSLNSNIDNESLTELDGIDETDLKGDTVSIIKIPESLSLDTRNYVIDMREQKSITEFQALALKSLRSTNGDVTIYLNTAKTLVALGKGDSNKLSRNIPILIKNILSESVKVYKDYKPGVPAKQVEGVDITQMRLNL